MVVYKAPIELAHTTWAMLVVHSSARSLVAEWREWDAAVTVQAPGRRRPASFMVVPLNLFPEIHLSQTDRDWFEHLIHECDHVAWFHKPHDEEAHAQLIAALAVSAKKGIENAHRQGKIRLSRP